MNAELIALLSVVPVIGSHPTDPTAGQKWVDEAAAMLRKIAEQKPAMRLNQDGVPEWLPPDWGGKRLPDTLYYADPIAEQSPVARVVTRVLGNEPRVVIEEIPGSELQPRTMLYAAPVAADPVKVAQQAISDDWQEHEFVAEAMRLAQDYRMAPHDNTCPPSFYKLRAYLEGKR